MWVWLTRAFVLFLCSVLVGCGTTFPTASNAPLQESPLPALSGSEVFQRSLQAHTLSASGDPERMRSLRIATTGKWPFLVTKIQPRMTDEDWRVNSDETLSLVFDSLDEVEQITASFLPADFNSNNDENDSFDSRSDNKGAEPEGVTIGEVDGRTYAFVGLERIGGVLVYDISNPAGATYVQYITTRDFSGDAEAGTAGDLGPEGLEFVPAADSPTGIPLLIVAHEVSGSIAIFEVQ